MATVRHSTRRRLGTSETVECLCSQIGSGALGVAAATDLAAAVVADGASNPTTKVFSALRGSNAERDLHRLWRRLYPCGVETYPLNLRMCDGEHTRNVLVSVVPPMSSSMRCGLLGRFNFA